MIFLFLNRWFFGSMLIYTVGVTTHTLGGLNLHFSGSKGRWLCLFVYPSSDSSWTLSFGIVFHWTMIMGEKGIFSPLPTWGNDPNWRMFFAWGWNHDLGPSKEFLQQKNPVWRVYTTSCTKNRLLGCGVSPPPKKPFIRDGTVFVHFCHSFLGESELDGWTSHKNHGHKHGIGLVPLEEFILEESAICGDRVPISWGGSDTANLR